MICVARKARRVSSKLWHGRKDDEYLGFWDTFRAKRVLGVGGKKPSIRKNASQKGLLMRTGPTGGSLMWFPARRRRIAVLEMRLQLAAQLVGRLLGCTLVNGDRERVADWVGVG